MIYPNNYISVIGAGSWGTTLASLLSEKGYDVTLWTYEPELADQINNERLNNIYLPNIPLPATLRGTNDIREAVTNARCIINVVPTQFIRSVFSQIKSVIREDSIIVSASKGIEIDTLLTPSMILTEVLNKSVSVLSGPSFAKEVILKLPTAVTLASNDRKNALLLQEMFNTDYLRVYTHDDVVGVELGGALKNVIAIAAGICDGLGLGFNARASLITRGLSEITRLGKAMNSREITFMGLSGLGDLVLTCTSALSRNYTTGYRLGKGEKLSEIIKTKSIVEGITTTKSAYILSNKYSIEMPVVEQVYLTLYEGKPVTDVVRDLMTRSLKSEFYGY